MKKYLNKNLKDYRKEMERMEAKSEAMLSKDPPPVDDLAGLLKRYGPPRILLPKKMITALLPAIMVALMALIALLSLIFSGKFK